MKWVTLIFLALNVAFFGWRLNAAERPLETPPAPVPNSAQVTRLLLLDEVNATELRSRNDVASTGGGASGGGAGGTGTCFSIGPVQSESEAERMGGWLTERGGDVQLRADERRELTLWWIYLPPFPTREDANQQVIEMKAKGVEDIFTIRNGDMAKAISLGVYSRKTSLERRMAELEGKGYQPRVVERVRQKKATWYDARFSPGFEFPGDKFTLAFPAAQVASTACGVKQVAVKPSGLATSSRDRSGKETAAESTRNQGG